MITFTITPDGPFSLEAAAAFGFGPNTGRPKPEEGVMRLAFVTDDFMHQVGIVLHQVPNGELTGTIEGTPGFDTEAVMKQVERVLSLNVAGKDWLVVGKRDPVIGELQAQHPGLRPVLFHSPYEAAAWSIISLRRNRTQATATRRKLAQAFGKVFQLEGKELEAFPTPEHLLRVSESHGLDPTRIERLHAVAQAALAGKLDPDYLLSLPLEQALSGLEAIPGIGPFFASLVMLRSTGAADILTTQEPRSPGYIAHYYHFEGKTATPEQIIDVSEKWKPFRTWAMVLIRVAGDRAELK